MLKLHKVYWITYISLEGFRTRYVITSIPLNSSLLVRGQKYLGGLTPASAKGTLGVIKN